MPGTWNFRPTPRRLIRCGGRPVTSSPWTCTVPEVGGNVPVIVLNSVVLPQPFGPMMQRTSPAPMQRSTPRRTRRPPNSLVSRRTSRTGRAASVVTPWRRAGPLPLALAAGLDQPDVLHQHLLLATRLRDHDVEIGVAVFGPEPDHAVPGLQRESRHRIDDALLVDLAGPLDALDEEPGEHVVRVDRVADDRVVAESLPDLRHERFGLRLVQRADEVRDGHDTFRLLLGQPREVVLAVAQPRQLRLRLAAGRHELLDERDGVGADDVEDQDLRTRLIDLPHRAGEVLHAERRVLLPDDTASRLLGRSAHRLVHLARPHVIAAEHVERVAVVLLQERNEGAHPLRGKPAVADDVATAGPAFVVGRVEERRLEALDGRLDGVAIGARHGAEDREHLITLDQLTRPLHRGLRIGLVVRDDHLESAPEDTAALVGLLDGQPRSLDPLLPQVLQSAGQRLEYTDLDRVRRPSDERGAEAQRGGARRALQQPAPPDGITTADAT